MGKAKTVKKYEELAEIRVYVPLHLRTKFYEESTEERRKYGEQLAVIFEERYDQ